MSFFATLNVFTESIVIIMVHCVVCGEGGVGKQ